MAAIQDKYADASVGNVTGSNAVNVFLGIGIAWTLAAFYHGFYGQQFVVPAGKWVEFLFDKIWMKLKHRVLLSYHTQSCFLCDALLYRSCNCHHHSSCSPTQKYRRWARWSKGLQVRDRIGSHWTLAHLSYHEQFRGLWIHQSWKATVICCEFSRFFTVASEKLKNFIISFWEKENSCWRVFEPTQNGKAIISFFIYFER